MALAKLNDTHLFPRKVFFFCHNLDSNSRDKTWNGEPCDRNAIFWLVSEDGTAVSKVCGKCAERTIPALPGWRTAPLFHDDPAFHDRVKPRSA